MNFLKNDIGETEEDVNVFLQKNIQEIRNKLDLLCKITSRLKDERFFSEDKRTFNKFFEFPLKLLSKT